MKITIISAGKVKEKYFLSAIDEYVKRLSRYTKMEFISLKQGHTTQEMSEKDILNVKEDEGRRILDRISEREYVIALDLKGTELTSEKFSDKIQNLRVTGKSNITFIIGGSHGLSGKVLKRADYKICFSKMTFPHKLMKVILVEQIYRAFKIINNEPYHK
ncbi:23S rRNA (pseudouridine(1915)-N(3))-methyltransferase RlmH [Clostridiaceae bacterium HSG29]|nr:23S rRNA (pseudouridine(1915)-N(3))-methyltransferase RlmH [Clostridiaceae bacterium HSG29]